MAPGLHKGYKLLKSPIERRELQLFTQIFDYVPSSVVAKDLSIGYDRFNEMILDTSSFRIKHAIVLGEYTEADPIEIFRLFLNESKQAKPSLVKSRKKSSPKKMK